MTARMGRRTRFALLASVLLAATACRVEFGPPGDGKRGGSAGSGDGPPAGEVWIYTSLYRNVVDDPWRERLSSLSPR